jgi:hypothetical protein
LTPPIRIEIEGVDIDNSECDEDYGSMLNDEREIKMILGQLARNLATCAATIQAFEKYAKAEGWDSRELLLLHEEAKQQLEVVFAPLLNAIDRLKD